MFKKVDISISRESKYSCRWCKYSFMSPLYDGGCKICNEQEKPFATDQRGYQIEPCKLYDPIEGHEGRF